MKVGILFDLDGTLLDTLEDLTDSVNFTLGQFQLPSRTIEEVRCFVGNGAEKLIRRALPGKKNDPDAEAVLDAFRQYYKTHCQIKTKPYTGILEALAVLQEKYPVAVVSNKPDSAVKPLCGQYFPGLYARGEDVDCPRKPAPDMLYLAMNTIGVERCIYVGDSEVDVLTAKNAGMPCISVLWGFRDRGIMEAAGAQYFCEAAEQLPQMIDRIVGEVYGK